MTKYSTADVFEFVWPGVGEIETIPLNDLEFEIDRNLNLF